MYVSVYNSTHLLGKNTYKSLVTKKYKTMYTKITKRSFARTQKVNFYTKFTHIMHPGIITAHQLRHFHYINLFEQLEKFSMTLII